MVYMDVVDAFIFLPSLEPTKKPLPCARIYVLGLHAFPFTPSPHYCVCCVRMRFVRCRCRAYEANKLCQTNAHQRFRCLCGCPFVFRQLANMSLICVGLHWMQFCGLRDFGYRRNEIYLIDCVFD